LNKFKSLREKVDVTQDRLAEYLGVTTQAISRWESEICYPDSERCINIILHPYNSSNKDYKSD